MTYPVITKTCLEFTFLKNLKKLDIGVSQDTFKTWDKAMSRKFFFSKEYFRKLYYKLRNRIKICLKSKDIKQKLQKNSILLGKY